MLPTGGAAPRNSGWRPEGVTAAAAADIASVRDALRREQGHVRSLIESLRTPQHEPQRDLCADLSVTLADAGAHWGVAASLTATVRAAVPGWLSHEVRQLVREAVANAARRGAAREVTVVLSAPAGGIGLVIADDGCGFDPGERSQRPWSISERVAALEGVLSVESGAAGTRLSITLPNRVSTGASA
jgi:signal transduction histidine kinase